MKTNYKNLVFEGGGVKGIAYGGALDVLDQMGILSKIQRVAGTSAGAINATMLALGYTSKEVSKVIAETNFKSFEDNGFFLGNIVRMVKKFGWNKGDAFSKWMGNQIAAKGGSADLTFEDHHKKIIAGNEQFRDLYIIATNLSQQKFVVFSYERTPKVKIKDAVRMSMSIPLYFQAFKYSDYTMVDGGVSYNYPINIFDNKKYISKPENGKPVDYGKREDYVFNYETLGFRLDSTEVINYAKEEWSIPPVEINNIKNYALGLINFMMEMANKVHLHNDDWCRTIFIDTLDVRTTEFELSQEKIKALITSGEKGVAKYFEWRDKDEHWKGYPK